MIRIYCKMMTFKMPRKMISNIVSLSTSPDFLFTLTKDLTFEWLENFCHDWIRI